MNRRAFVAQRAALNTGWMTIGTWFASHPPLSRRMAALDPALLAGSRLSPVGALRAAAIVGLILLPVMHAGWMGASRFTEMVQQATQQAKQNADNPSGPADNPAPASEATQD